MRDGAVGEAHVVAPVWALRHVDARRPVLARQNHACARERRTQHVEHARRLVSQRIEPPLPLFAPHEPQVGKESVHGILRAGGCGSVRAVGRSHACALGSGLACAARSGLAPITASGQLCPAGSAAARTFACTFACVLESARAPLPAAAGLQGLEGGRHERRIAVQPRFHLRVRKVAPPVARCQDGAPHALVGLEHHDLDVAAPVFARVSRLVRAFARFPHATRRRHGCRKPCRAAAYDRNRFHAPIIRQGQRPAARSRPAMSKAKSAPHCNF